MLKVVLSLKKRTSAEEVTRTYGISKGTLYNKYSGTSASLERAGEDVRNITNKWLDDYSNNCPRLALENLIPNKFSKKFEEKELK